MQARQTRASFRHSVKKRAVPQTGDCPRRSGCRTLAFWEGLGAVLEQYADGVTLAQLCGAPGGGKEDA